MTEWKEYTVQDLIDLNMIEEPLDGNHGGIHPKTTDYVPVGVPFIMANNLVDGGVDLENCSFITEEQAKSLRKGFAHPGDILLTHKATMGRTAIVPDQYPVIILTPQVTYYRIKKDINRRYLKYYFDSPDFQNTLSSWANSGSTRAYLGITAQHKLPVILPPLEIQDKIASILSVLDFKIENNKQINRNLSEQAQALYKSWFVDLDPFEGERPADWQDGTVDDLASEVVCGKTPSTKKEEYYGNDVPFVTIPDMHGCVYTVHTGRSLSELGAESQSKKTLPKNSICISCIGTAGLVTLLPVPSQTNQQINSIIPKNNYSPYYIYLLMSTMGETINKLGQAGSTIVNLNKTQFGKMEVLIPSIKTMSDFDEIVEPIFSAILSNQIENKKLANLRDILLPKLMSGEIDVSDLEI